MLYRLLRLSWFFLVGGFYILSVNFKTYSPALPTSWQHMNSSLKSLKNCSICASVENVLV